jgi:uncharacterized protein (TIGR02996 family)
MHHEEGFLKALLLDPSDDTTRLVYADFLEEHGETDSAGKIEYLRATVELARIKAGKHNKKVKRVQKLAATLIGDWLAVVSRLPIENCAKKRDMLNRMFYFPCDKRWEDLQPTANDKIRFCSGCQHEVFYSHTLPEARQHVQENHCVAINPGVIRILYDLYWTRIPIASRLGPQIPVREIEGQEDDVVEE